MSETITMQYTSIRTRLVDGKFMIALKHTARGDDGTITKTPWIEMTAQDTETLIKKMQESLDLPERLIQEKLKLAEGQ